VLPMSFLQSAKLKSVTKKARDITRAFSVVQAIRRLQAYLNLYFADKVSKMNTLAAKYRAIALVINTLAKIKEEGEGLI
jgi:hypothetical protein